MRVGGGHLPRTLLSRRPLLLGCREWEGAWLGISGLWLPAGWGFSMGTAYHYHSWRLFVIVCALPCSVALLALKFMPESPRFLLEVSWPQRLSAHARLCPHPRLFRTGSSGDSHQEAHPRCRPAGFFPRVA